MCISSVAGLGKGFDFDTYGDRGYTVPEWTGGGVEGEFDGKDDKDMEGEGVEGREYVALSSAK